MESFEDRLVTHLGTRAAEIQPIDQGVQYVISEGTRKRTGRVMLWGVAATVAVVGLAAGAIMVFTRHQSDQSITPAGKALASSLPAAVAVPANFEWSVEASPTGQLGASAWWTGASNGVSAYTFGTVPHQPGEKTQQQLYATSDGVEYQAAGLPFDPWISDLDSSQPGRVYAIGTVAADLSYAYRTGVSTDDGATWQYSPLPMDMAPVRNEFGGMSAVGAQVVAGGPNQVAIVQTTAFVQQMTIDGVDTQYGTQVAADGVDVFGAPTDMDAVAARECPPGWPLVQGPARERITFDANGNAVPTTAVFIGKPGGGAEWHCESPDPSQPDVWVDPARVHGDVVRTVPFDQLHLDDDSLKALRNQVRVFHATDGLHWTEADIDAGGSNLSMPGVLWTGTQFALRAPGPTGGQLWLSPDGVAWQQATLPAGTDLMSFGALADGTLVLAGRLNGEAAAYTSADGTSWSGVSLAAQLGLDPTWRIQQWQMVTSPLGVSLLISAGQDPLAAMGAAVVEHGNFRLRATDQQGGVELLDRHNNVIDRVEAMYMPGAKGPEGRLATVGNGNVNVLDPATGEVVDVFSQQEVSLAIDKVLSSQEGQRLMNRQLPSAFWALDSLDGRQWGITRVEGVSANNSWLPSAGLATTVDHAYRIVVNTTGGTSGAVIVGRPVS